MSYDELKACESGTPVRFKDGTVGALTRWYAGTGTGGVHVRGRERLIEIDPAEFEFVAGTIMER